MDRITTVLCVRAIIIGLALLACVRPAQGQGTPIPQTGWRLHAVDSQETETGSYVATNAFDGNPSTMWHTRWLNDSPPPPHDIQIDLGAGYSIGGVRYLPRQDGKPNGNVAQYEIYVSADGVNWGSAVAAGTFASSGAEKEVQFTPKAGRYVRFRALSEVNGMPWTAAAELNVLQSSAMPPVSPISRAGWTVRFVDSQETETGSYLATNAFDGNPSTMWHTRWLNDTPAPPHEMQIDLAATHPVAGFRYLPRQDGKPNGNVAQYEFYVSADGITWGAPVAAGTFVNSATEKQVLFTAKSGRFVRFRALSEVNGGPWISAAELNVLAATGPVNQPPDGLITSPPSDTTIMPGQALPFAATGSDPDGNVPLSYAWTFGTAGPPPSTSQNPGSVTFPAAGVYTVTLTVRDALGLADPTPATRTITVHDPTGASASLVSHAGWQLHFVDSEEMNVPGFRATNAFDGNPATAWSTRWYLGGPPAPHDLQIDLGAVHTLVGFRYLPYHQWQQGRIGDYEFYVSADGITWDAPVARGAFPDRNTTTAEDVRFPPKQGRYIWLRALSEVNAGDYRHTTVGEIDVWRAGGGANQPPVASITSPASTLVVRAGTTVTLSGNGADPDGHLPLSARWSVDPGAGIADSTAMQPGPISFDRPGTFTVRLAVTDARGATGTNARTVTVTSGEAVASSGWVLRSVNSQAAGAPASNAFDDNPNTFWSSQDTTPFPHEIQIDLRSTPILTGFSYLPRQDGDTAGNVDRYEFYVSADGVQWGPPVAEGRFDNLPSRKHVAFDAKPGRYIRFRAFSDLNWWNFITVAEIDVVRHQCLTPSVRLVSPRTNHVQSSTTLGISADACVASGQGVRFVVDGLTRGTDFSPPFSITVAGLSAADHVIEAQLIDAGGNPVAGAASYDVAAPVGIGEAFVAIGDGTTTGYSDDIATDDNSVDRRNLQGGYTPILADALTAARGYPVSVINRGVGGATVADAAASIVALVQQYSSARAFLLVSGHNEAQDGMPSGRGLLPGSTGYAGSFKDYVQRIITAVRGAGRGIVLAKAPPVIGAWSHFDPAIQEYNMVIDELVADPNNGITAIPPDFYTYFSSRTATHYGNDVEMNGRGYQGMADLWRQSILGAP